MNLVEVQHNNVMSLWVGAEGLWIRSMQKNLKLLVSNKETGFFCNCNPFSGKNLARFSVATAQVLLEVNNTICQVLLAKKFWYEYYKGENISLSNRYPKYCQICSGFSSAVFVLECRECPENQVDSERMVTAKHAGDLRIFTGGVWTCPHLHQGTASPKTLCLSGHCQIQLSCLNFTVWNKTGDVIQRWDVKGLMAATGDFKFCWNLYSNLVFSLSSGQLLIFAGILSPSRLLLPWLAEVQGLMKSQY